jgi:N-sulfoglucosamine sulfohydrolase
MRGKSFLPSSGRRYIFGHRDRVDEMMDMARSVRSKDFLYIRNFMPHLGYNQQSAWIDQGEVRKDFYALAKSGSANAAQSQYLNPTRPREELYDCNADPLNLINLAKSDQHARTLQQVRKVLRNEMLNSRDLGLVPEIELWRQTKGTTPYQWGKTDAFDAAAILDAADLVGTDDFPAIGQSLSSGNASVRYWAAVSCTAADHLTDAMQQQLRIASKDESIAVRIESANALARHTQNRAAIDTLIGLFDNQDETVVLHAARAIELLGDPSTKPAVQRLADRFIDEPSDMAWFIRFTTSGYLNRH